MNCDFSNIDTILTCDFRFASFFRATRFTCLGGDNYKYEQQQQPKSNNTQIEKKYTHFIEKVHKVWLINSSDLPDECLKSTSIAPKCEY